MLLKQLVHFPTGYFVHNYLHLELPGSACRHSESFARAERRVEEVCRVWIPRMDRYENRKIGIRISELV